MYQQIQQLAERSDREKEILAASPKYGIAKQFAAEFRRIESDRLAKRQALLKEAWEKLQALGYTKFQYSGNAAYQSGHSDYLESSENWVKWGVVAPDGTKFEGQASWTEGIIPAIAHAGI